MAFKIIELFVLLWVAVFVLARAKSWTLRKAVAVGAGAMLTLFALYIGVYGVLVQPMNKSFRAPPEMYDHFFREGMVAYEDGEIEDAIEHFEKAVAADPGRAEAHLYLGITYARQEKKVQAAEHYRRYVALEPLGHRIEEVKKILRDYGEARGD